MFIEYLVKYGSYSSNLEYWYLCGSKTDSVGGEFILGGMALNTNLLSEKRHKVIEYIDRFGVITSAQLERYLSDLGVMTIYRARAQGEEMGFIERGSYGQQKVLSITKQGSEYVGNIGRQAGISYSTLQHSLTINEVIFKLMYELGYRDRGYEFITERELREEIFDQLSYERSQQPNIMRTLRNEIPDFLLEKDGETLAFEVELNRKTRKRLHQKLKLYKQSLEQGKYTHVFYITKDENLKKQIDKEAQNLSLNLRLLTLNELKKKEG
uniref:replication-relaxation family protein n=1 Tax=Bacillaceae bacterium JMAK1 TaxID=1028381 RepID=UPI0003AC33FE|nr:replication-relaxation family protein [Bacillaceae bacterium JMAK1]AGQ45423.1 Putative DNA relaxation protein [Bacillaceae bacterium JMAK1]